jgi:antitoxin YefM
MPIETTYTDARENLAALWDEVTANHEIVIIHRRGAKDIALIEADELRSLMETVHLLRSPRNAQRLLTALNRALANEGNSMSVERLRQQMGLLDEAERNL